MGAATEDFPMTNNNNNNEAPMTPGMEAAPKSASAPKSGLKKLFSRRKNSSSGAPPPDSPNVEGGGTPKSLSAQRSDRASKKGGRRWSARLPGSGKKNEESKANIKNSTTNASQEQSADYAINISSSLNGADGSPKVAAATQVGRESSFFPEQVILSPEEMEIKRAEIIQKQQIKERDGFCRRVDFYDGQVITVDGKPAYELGSYLGGGVAGVVYEGHRLRPVEDYPVRLGAVEDTPLEEIPELNKTDRPPSIVWGCMPGTAEEAVSDGDKPQKTMPRGSSHLTADNSIVSLDANGMKKRNRTFREDQALEMTVEHEELVIIEDKDAPSRSDNYAKAVSMNVDDNDDSSITYGFMEETVAIKVLNPVGFRTLAPETLENAVVARRGAKMEPEVMSGQQPMEERHVWWLINPNSRNLRTLQRYAVPSDPSTPRRVEVDRGTADRGLRISLVAAYRDEQNQLKELPLTRCIEIWGHVPFGATDAEFKGLLKAIDAINAGNPPPPLPSFFHYAGAPGRVGTEKTAATDLTDNSSLLDGSHLPNPMTSKRTGIYRAATTSRTTVYCDELKAYIALPAVPSKYIKWLRQRRAATKEIRNMMLIGRHRNVVHLFEVLELIQEKKSTMFLILELVKGGELFDLISSNAAKLAKDDVVPPGYTESETVMRKFFRELSSGVRYCHHNGM